MPPERIQIRAELAESLPSCGSNRSQPESRTRRPRYDAAAMLWYTAQTCTFVTASRLISRQAVPPWG